MPDAAEQLQRLYLAGFEIETFERFPRVVGVLRDGFIQLMEPAPDGLRGMGSAGWRMGEVMGVLLEKDGRMVFQSKAEVVEATPDRLEGLRCFQQDIEAVLAG